MKNNSSLKISFLFALLLSSFFGFAQYTAIPDPNFEQALIDLGIDSGVIDHQVLTANAANVKILSIPGRGIFDLSGIEAFTKLELLDLGLSDNNNPFIKNKIPSLNLSNNLLLRSLDCGYNELTTLDVTKNTALEVLVVENNQLSSLDVSQNILLVSLFCSNNNLTALDVTKNTSLVGLSCTSNKISTLDVSKNIFLRDFSCASNNLSNIDVSANVNLDYFNILANHLTSLDVTKNTKLSVLNCRFNQLKSLDISTNTNLFNFWCDSNQLTYLNLKNGQNSKLTALDLKNNPALTCVLVDNVSYSNTNWSTFKDASASYSNNCNAVAATAPILKSTGNQLYCPQTNIKIVEDFSITHDPAETGTEAIYIQISSGYAAGLDKLELSNLASHPSVSFSWDPSAGKLTLSSATGGDVLYSELELAIKDVVYSNSSATASGTRTFSITLGQANYLPSTQHYYQYIPIVGITWTNAKIAAESDANIYYGIRGYLATILSADEAKLIGEQASGTGWIGGSDAEIESVWKWVTGPEAGTVFWNGNANGSTPNYAFWNNGEPNQQGDEDYAHITQPGVGLRGSWNDLSNTGSLTPGDSYQPKGYIVEYGGMPGDPILQIATSTKITIPVINTLLTPNPVCDSGSFTLNATATTGATISWYDAAVGGNLLTTGATYTTPTINTTTIYYADAGCETNRRSVTAVVNKTPNNPVSTSPTVTRCGAGTVTLEASSNVGTINWFTDASGGTSIYNGNSFTTPSISSNTTYYAEASNNGCINTNRTAVNIIIYTPPVVTDETLVLCQSQKITLNAGIAGMSYLWSNGATTQTTEVNAGGKYTVVVTDPGPGSCSSTKTVTVEEHLKPEIDKIDVAGTRAIINTTKPQDYFEYSVDGVNFQDSNIFYDVPGGLQTAYVREKSGCGQDTQQFVVLVFPPFFTPNNDSYNDVWEVTGMENYPQAEVTIFDRYGKLIANLNHSKMSWDGTFERTPLPASDYWYALKIDNTLPILKGHFSLKR
ncbi:gliding motility-associated-like protein [Flavobacterium sp. 270]|uniref:Ig-like domain-containing protein n=1 Tax=Flavobacterium sp. 270 TaxID=2512114 RepID=UPI0010662B74|nr:T9SS type B sorting domain-containing protein [Flavobacterium sp. 270]TDW46409.1 gliding motility-associated-like protein [Flavobacterium sp. 270]